MSTYSASTGQLIDPSKCSIIFSNNCPDAVVDEVKGSLDISQQVFDPKYLGLLVPDGRMNKGMFETLQASLSRRLVDWSEQYMSVGNNKVLIKKLLKQFPRMS